MASEARYLLTYSIKQTYLKIRALPCIILQKVFRDYICKGSVHFHPEPIERNPSPQLHSCILIDFMFHPECRRELAELLAEAKYFCIEPLSDACEKAMKNLKEPAETVVPIVRVPLITSPKEEQALIAANSTKPIVKLLINRHNNKYSYTGASDDNILKNIELFDKLSLRFSNRVRN